MRSLIDRYDFFIFDLDDTLYPEIKYLDEAYKNISIFLSNNTKCKSKAIYEFLIEEFKRNGRGNLLDKMFSYFDIDSKFLESALKIMRTFETKKKIKLYKYFYKLLPDILNNSKRVFIVTNGNVIQQKNKVSNIKWKSLDKELVFIYANEYEKKPSNKSFKFIKENYKIKEELTIMIGDSIFDKEYAENCNIDFIFIEEFNKINK